VAVYPQTYIHKHANVDFSEFDDFLLRFSGMTSQLREFLVQFVKNRGWEILARTSARTPVDTGALKAAWQIGEVGLDGDTLYIEILNGMEYASFVELGHATRAGNWVDGRYMVTVSMDEVAENIQTYFDEEFSEFVRAHGLGD